MVIIPIFIHRKSDEQIKKEIEIERKWREIMDREHKAEAEKLDRIRREKIQKKIEEEERIRKWANEDEQKNPDDWKILPYGWSPFGFYL